MALLYIDSFDYLPNNTQLFVSYFQAMNYYNGNGWFYSVPGAFGGVALTCNPNGNVGVMTQDLVLPTAGSGVSDETIIGQRMTWGPNFGTAGFTVGSSTYGSQFTVYVNSFGSVVFQDYTGTILAVSAPGLVQVGGWNYFEIRFVIGSRMRIRVNTALVIDRTGSFGRSNTTWNYMSWHGQSVSGGVMFGWDDLYALTTSGGGPNTDYLGNVRVRAQLPIAPGDVTGLTPTGAATDWQAQLQPVQPIDLTKYASTATVGNYDLYDVTANAAARNLFGVQARGMFMQDDATQLTGALRIKTGGVEYDAPQTFLLSSSLDTYYGIWDQNPNTTAAWTNSEVNALQVGPKLLASA